MTGGSQEQGEEVFEYRDGCLHCDDVSAMQIAEQFGTPVFVYARRALVEHFHTLKSAFSRIDPRICFSIKSCHNLHILRQLHSLRAWFDAVSIGEVRRALESGANPSSIVFAGVGKTEAEIAEAVRLQVGCFNVESASELNLLASHSFDADQPVHAALRVNPDVDAKTHPFTTTGLKENKFGIEFKTARELFRQYRDHPKLNLRGLHVHIGSPVNTIEPYVEAVTRVLGLIDALRDEGCSIESFNLGGGWGTNYTDNESPPLAQYADALAPLLAGRDLEIRLEPGRSIAANAGVMLTRVVHIKQGKTKRFVIVDAAMTDLIRPALYNAYHFMWPIVVEPALVPLGRCEDAGLDGLEKVDVVGPVCESGDFFAQERALPTIAAGDVLAIHSAGAYGSVMGSQYNSRLRPSEVLVDGAGTQLIRRRETFDDLVRCEREVEPAASAPQ